MPGSVAHNAATLPVAPTYIDVSGLATCVAWRAASGDAVADLADHHTRGHELTADAAAGLSVAADAAPPVPIAVGVAVAAVGDPRGVALAEAAVERDPLGGVDHDRTVPASAGEVHAGAGADHAEAVVAGRDGLAEHLGGARVQTVGGAGRGGRRRGRGDTERQSHRGKEAHQGLHQPRT